MYPIFQIRWITEANKIEVVSPHNETCKVESIQVLQLVFTKEFAEEIDHQSFYTTINAVLLSKLNDFILSIVRIILYI